MSKETSQQTTGQMAPEQFASEYTDYYENREEDSHEMARRYMIKNLVNSIEEKLFTQQFVYVLDIGAGKQQLESELQKHPQYQRFSNRLKIFTLDIAYFSKEDLRADGVPHIEANGANLPFGENTFDIVFSCMAIDFMPRQETFEEVKRTLKPGGELLINFHHPELIDQARIRYEEVLRNRRSLFQAKKFGAKSHKLGQVDAKIEEVRIEVQDLEFILNVFPNLVFYCPEEIMAFLNTKFPGGNAQVQEFSKINAETGWYGARVKNDEDQAA